MMKKLLYISIAIFCLLFIGTAYYGYSQYIAVKKGVENMQIEFEDSMPQNMTEDKAFLFLLLGIGDRPGDPGRADSIICVSVNPKKQSILMFNIPRDTRMEIVGRGIYDKINHAYTYGSTEMVKETAEQFLNQKMDYVIQINMQGMRQLVDTFGGIEVVNEFDFSQKDELGKKSYHYDKGLIHLDGERALHYSRMRKSDPNGDLGRNHRQQQVLQALAQKAVSASSVLKIQEVVDILGENIKTNVSFDEMKFFFTRFNKDWKNYDIDKLEIVGEDQIINDIYYYEVSDDEKQNITEKLEDHLQASM